MNEFSQAIRGGDYEGGGAASRRVKELLKKVGADPAVVRRAMIAAYEAEMNVVIHSHGGELRARLDAERLVVEVVDTGPGIPDLEQAMRPGFSTAPAAARELGFGAGLGLPNIKKNSDEFEVQSAAGTGTRVRFVIALKPAALYGSGRRSLEIRGEQCKQSLRCLSACPTQAVRVFRGRPEVLDYLCIDCTACIAACPTGTLTLGGPPLPSPPPEHAVLAVPAEALVQYGPGVTAEQAMAELSSLGFGEILVTAPWEAALRQEVREEAQRDNQPLPVISPACPAVVALIETRFASLVPHLAPLASAAEAIAATFAGRPLYVVVSCPSQRTALMEAGTTPAPQTVLPSALRDILQPRLRRNHPTTRLGHTPPHPPPDLLRVTGLRHVLAVLEAIENGLAEGIRVVEPWACDEGCFGSPLLGEDPFLTQSRYDASATLRVSSNAAPVATPRRQPFKPRPGLRLDPDMARAIQKLSRIDRLRRTLPGSDCGMCGAPTCASLAEDIVLGRASAEACVRQERSGASGVDQEKKT
mgnify:CR=1 FL=1